MNYALDINFYQFFSIKVVVLIQKESCFQIVSIMYWQYIWISFRMRRLHLSKLYVGHCCIIKRPSSFGILYFSGALHDIKNGVNQTALSIKHVSIFVFRENMTLVLNYVTATLKPISKTRLILLNPMCLFKMSSISYYFSHSVFFPRLNSIGIFTQTALITLE